MKSTPEFATAHELLLETQRARAKNHAQALEGVIAMLEYTIFREWSFPIPVSPLERALRELRSAQKEFESFYRNGA